MTVHTTTVHILCYY